MNINDNSLRPCYLKDFIGQEALKEKLEIYIKAAKRRNESLDHILFYGPPGVGKTTLANLISNEMNASLKVINGGNIEKPYELISVLLSLQPGDILFIDEIHRLPRQIEEILYSAMEDYFLQIIINKNDSCKNEHIDLPPFTLIGATTLLGDISFPLRTRFNIIEKVGYYKKDEMVKIVKRTCDLYDINASEDFISSLAKLAKNTPRIANNLVKRVRDFYEYNNNKYLTMADFNSILKLLNINRNGLTLEDQKYLLVLYKNKQKAIGIETLSLLLNENEKTIRYIVEPYLLTLGLISKTKVGRLLTDKGIKYVNKSLISHNNE